MAHIGLFALRALCVLAFFTVLMIPSWWAAGRCLRGKGAPFFRVWLAVGIALVGYLSAVNLIGRFTQSSFIAVAATLTGSAILAVFALVRFRDELSLRPLLASWRTWILPVLLAIVLGVPQWFCAVCTPFWDEVACSSIQLPAPNQFAEGVYPPRHNAFPDLPAAYHYGFALISGTIRLLTGLSANVTIDLGSTALWLFIFLFCYAWLRELEFCGWTALWGSFAVLIGDGLAWVYLHRADAYSGIEKNPPPSDLLHAWDPALSWLQNLIAASQAPSLYLRASDGKLSNLPWNIAAQFEQHSVSAGLALAMVALYFLVTWLGRREFSWPLAIANIAAFGLMPLGHAVFGAVAATSAGLCLLLLWIVRRTRVDFFKGFIFGFGMLAVALLHGGMLSRGPEYGSSEFLTLRDSWGYAKGPLLEMIHWHLAAFGLPLVLTLVAWGAWLWKRETGATERNLLFLAVSFFTVISYLTPNLAFYSSDTLAAEQFTEISKFFFCAHFGFAMVSIFGIARLAGAVRRVAVVACILGSGIIPVAFCYTCAVDDHGKFMGFYRSPYYRDSIEEQMGKALNDLKKGPREVYFDASADERVHGFLSEMLIFGGSVFTLTPSRFERTGIGFRIAEDIVAKRYVENSRVARLLPGSAEMANVSWYYARPLEDMMRAPLIVRSRFEKLVQEKYLTWKTGGGARALFKFDKPTFDLDSNLNFYLRPKVVTPGKSDWDGDGKNDLIFYDYANQRILTGNMTIDLPPWLRGEILQMWVASFGGDRKADLLLGRMRDTQYGLGKRIEENVEVNWWGWTVRDSASRVFTEERNGWQWDRDVPFIADLDADGNDSQLSYRGGEFFLHPEMKLPGPSAPAGEFPFPFGGRFLEGSRGELGLWSHRTGMVRLQTLDTGKKVEVKWGGDPGDIFVPADYDGDGYLELGLWQKSSKTWVWQRAPDGPVTQATFGTESCLPLPFDHDGDGRADLSCWEPRDAKIYVSFDRGRSVGLVVPVPPNAIPIFVNMN